MAIVNAWAIATTKAIVSSLEEKGAKTRLFFIARVLEYKIITIKSPNLNPKYFHLETLVSKGWYRQLIQNMTFWPQAPDRRKRIVATNYSAREIQRRKRGTWEGRLQCRVSTSAASRQKNSKPTTQLVIIPLPESSSTTVHLQKQMAPDNVDTAFLQESNGAHARWHNIQGMMPGCNWNAKTLKPYNWGCKNWAEQGGARARKNARRRECAAEGTRLLEERPTRTNWRKVNTAGECKWRRPNLFHFQIFKIWRLVNKILLVKSVNNNESQMF